MQTGTKSGEKKPKWQDIQETKNSKKLQNILELKKNSIPSVERYFSAFLKITL